jgi:trypsin
LNVRLVLVVFLLGVLALLPASASAITGGQPDQGHPYVALLASGSEACSGTLLSPTVLLTAGHCFGDGAPVRAYFGQAPTPGVGFFTGTNHVDPQFAMGVAGGLPGFGTHDVAIVVFSTPIPASATNGQYGQLPASGLVDTLAMKTPVDLVGYGMNGFSTGGGQPQPVTLFRRFGAQTTLIASNDTLRDSFVKLHANKGGFCFGDSGGPDLLGGTNTVLAVNSFVTNDLCAGNTYSYRVDTPEAFSWITTAVAADGGSLSH